MVLIGSAVREQLKFNSLRKWLYIMPQKIHLGVGEITARSIETVWYRLPRDMDFKFQGLAAFAAVVKKDCNS